MNLVHCKVLILTNKQTNQRKEMEGMHYSKLSCILVGPDISACVEQHDLGGHYNHTLSTCCSSMLCAFTPRLAKNIKFGVLLNLILTKRRMRKMTPQQSQNIIFCSDQPKSERWTLKLDYKLTISISWEVEVKQILFFIYFSLNQVGLRARIPMVQECSL